MAAPGRFHRSQIGCDRNVATLITSGLPTTFAMAALNSGWCARFTAPDTRDVLTVYVNWGTVTAAGVVECRLETIDATTGKPTGTLYDANATKSQAPVAGWQAFTFNTPPTTGLTAGTEYAVVLLTTTGGTAHTLFSHNAAGAYPCIALTAADGTTRSNFAEVASAVPVMTLVMEDSVEEVLALQQFAAVNNYNVFGTNAAGAKFVVPTGQTWEVAGIMYTVASRVGTPAGDLRVRIFNSSDSAVSGTTRTIDKDSLASVNGRQSYINFAAPVSLAAGTYRIVFDSASSANSSNCWRVRAGVARASGNVPSGFILTSTADVTAGTISWTDTATEQPGLNLLLNDTTASGSPDYPSEDDVRSGVSYDSGGQTGNMTLPAAADVQSAVTYGTSGTEFTGTFTAPAVGDVEAGVTYGGGGTEFTGTFEVPAEADVADTVGYGAGGTEFTGTLTGGGDWTSTEKEQIRYRLGIDGTTDTPATNVPHLGTVDANVIEVNGSAATTDPDISDAADRVLLALPAESPGEPTGLPVVNDVENIVGDVVSDIAQQSANAVLDEALSGHTTAGSAGKALTDILDDTGTSGVVLAASYDLYHADVQYTVDDLGAKDEFTVRFFKNGVRQTSGITSPQIQVVKRANGTDLIAATNMTQVGSTAAYKYDASGAERLTAGEAAEVIVTWTQDASSRSFARMVGRDSTA